MNSSRTVSTIQQKNLLRKEIRKQRRQLTPLQQRNASLRLIKNLKRFKLLIRGKHIALYLGNDGEICPKALLSEIRSWGKKAYLPVIHPLKTDKIVFCEVHESTRFIKNRFNISEPEFKSSRHIGNQFLSTVLLPLVAFDCSGNRMGMGGGFYDRAFAYKHRSRRNKPRLLGLAHELQRQVSLPTNDWDVGLDAIVTDRNLYASKY
jgi:5-formyltetrahydrofolate cyclo-ligase